MNRRPTPLLLLLAVLLSTLAMACGDDGGGEKDTTTPDAEVDTTGVDGATDTNTVDTNGTDTALPPGYTSANIRLGAHLYDQWWSEKGVDPPTTDHPLYPSDSTYAGSGARTWRCSECHGWDYKGVDGVDGTGEHYTGIKGFWDVRDTHPQELFDVLTGGLANHDFQADAGLSESDIWALVRFMREGAQDASGLLNGTAFKGTAANGATRFTERCEQCHGADGTRFEILPGKYLGTTARAEPYRAIHRIYFGQPVAPDMPSASEEGWSMDDIADLGAHIQTFPDQGSTQSRVTRGGRLYDNWPAMLETTTPNYTHPLYPDTGTLPNAETWRCVNCHGWDYKGRDGVWASGHAKYTGIIGVLGARTKTRTELTAALTGGLADHNFQADTRLTAQDIDDIVNFLMDGVIEMSPYIDASGAFTGNYLNGQTVFAEKCVRCHGPQGKDVILPSGDAGLGAAATSEPWRVFHKMRNGQPTNPMMTRLLEESTFNTPEDQADLGAFLMTLPKQ